MSESAPAPRRLATPRSAPPPPKGARSPQFVEPRSPHPAAALLIALAACLVSGCWGSQGPELVVYTALDETFSKPILETFQRETGIRVRANYDVESTKTVGLFQRLVQERRRPRCDIFWNNEILHTLRLQQLDLLAAYESAIGRTYPAGFRSPQGYWYGFAARARVLLVNTDQVPQGERPSSVLDLADPKWKGRAGIAKPLFGTTATHAAVLFAAWGPERAEQFFRRLSDNVQVHSGNRQVALAVAGGQLAFGLTDTDDANVERLNGMPVEIVFPDQQASGCGALLIPNTVAAIKGGPNGGAAERFVDYVLGAEVETRLAQGPSAQFPLNPQTRVRPPLAPAAGVRWMDADFQAAADGWERAARFLRDEFARTD